MIRSARPLPAVRVIHSTTDKCIVKGVPGLGPVVQRLCCGDPREVVPDWRSQVMAGSGCSGWEGGLCRGQGLPREGGWLD